ncbi:TonB-dependent receptor [Chryseotalea sanaruensis]|uniref:TonB-dependent receptor n=2 Tax=Chryseotalea sanaruensis TaxID=2482724 RepID=A0A401UEX4_9BACT|nr:TonB-dependent receptor [Chryseotalea sanaruensis]
MVCANSTFAQESTTEEVEDLFELSLEDLLNLEITTATKTAGKSDVAPAITEVITAEQLVQRGYQNLGQLLNDIANNHQDRSNWGIGEPVHQNVGFGFRFDSGQNILMLFNGQRLNAFLPGNRFGGEEYLLDNIERIEIIRGPGSALYGTGAFTAVINIISKKISTGNAEGIARAGVSVTPTAGGITYNGSLLTPIAKKGSLNAAFRYSNEDGQELQVNNSLFGNQKLKDGINYTYDGEAIMSWNNLNVQGKFTKQSRNTFTGFNAVNPTNMDELELYMHAYSLGIDYSKKMNKSTFKLSGGWHNDNWTEVALIPIFAPQTTPEEPPQLDVVDLYRNGENIQTSFFIDGQGADTRSLDAEAQWTYNYINSNNIVFGVYLADDKVIDAVRPSELNLVPLQFYPFREIRDPQNNWLFDLNASRQTLAFYMQADYHLTKQLYINVGARFDNFSGTGVLASQKYSEFNPKIALVFDNEIAGTLKALAGTATRIPNGFETLSSVSILGDPNNTPERIQTYQLQWIKNWKSNFRTEAGFFHSSITNRLETNANISDELRANGFIGQFINVGNGVIQSNNGFDAKVVTRFSKTILQVNMTQYFNSDNGFAETIMYMPFTMLNIDYTIPVKWMSFNLGGNYRGGFEQPESDLRAGVKDYFVARLNLVATPSTIPFQFNLMFRNLFNTTYYYPSSSIDFVNHFPARGLDVSIGLTYKPKL